MTKVSVSLPLTHIRFGQIFVGKGRLKQPLQMLESGSYQRLKVARLRKRLD